MELKGVNRLVRLCKEEKERNHSDGVLVACLVSIQVPRTNYSKILLQIFQILFFLFCFQAALRKIAANCGTEALKELNAMELVEPRLLDSFLLYSSKQESYV